MKYWVTCPADVEKYIKDEIERPYNYKAHFYPCYIEYDEPWDFHFFCCYYFMYKSIEEAISMRHTNLLKYIDEKYQ